MLSPRNGVSMLATSPSALGAGLPHLAGLPHRKVSPNNARSSIPFFLLSL